ncbi:zinc ribbon domain-containing protein [uncultured Sphingomonas sp.]|uniref:zinc ribbon domain-containing protein n=1 Tax=uncultured Sphingomonas sp. TaxID=158754 RepID=UPI0025F1BD8D|nr:zinc ribbon domain-containing protein [uncultured Sphingomonas sp.]
MDSIFLLVLFWIIFTVGSAAIASNKGRSGGLWLVLGFLFGPIALVVIASLPRNAERDLRAGLQSGKMRRCPYCAEPIRAEAVKCRHCGEDVPAAPRHDIWGRVRS